MPDSDFSQISRDMSPETEELIMAAFNTAGVWEEESEEEEGVIVLDNAGDEEGVSVAGTWTIRYHRSLLSQHRDAHSARYHGLENRRSYCCNTCFSKP